MSETIIKIMADGLLLPIVVIGVYALLFRVPKGHRFEAYGRVVMAGLTAYLIAKLVGGIYQPAELRPFEALGLAPGASFLNNPGFPSDHVLFTAAITFAVLLETKAKWAGALLVILTISLAIGRVLALVHTPLDVAGGAVIAAIGALWYLTARIAKNTSRKQSLQS